jgi:hypothetical protein
MGMFEDIGKGNVSTVLVGLGVAMVAPTVLPALASGLRPLAKALVKGGVTLYDAAREGVAEAGEQLSDLVAETRAEMGNGVRRTTRQEPDMANGEGETGEEESAAAGRTRRRRARS